MQTKRSDLCGCFFRLIKEGEIKKWKEHADKMKKGKQTLILFLYFSHFTASQLFLPYLLDLVGTYHMLYADCIYVWYYSI